MGPMCHEGTNGPAEKSFFERPEKGRELFSHHLEQSKLVSLYLFL
jgi:hypothetical protein